ncbi:MAG: hypothetical protein U1D30_00235 [Planctomycetota bacterium]
MLAASPLAYSLRAPNSTQFSDENKEPADRTGKRFSIRSTAVGIGSSAIDTAGLAAFRVLKLDPRRLNRPLPGDNALRQVGTVAAMARAARVATIESPSRSPRVLRSSIA